MAEDHETQLFVDQDVTLPAPLDEHIAHVSVWTPSNHLVEGYDVSVATSFGKERVTLECDDFSVEVLFSLLAAEVALEFHNGVVSILEVESDSHSDAWLMTESDTNQNTGERGVSSELGAKVKANDRLSIGTDASAGIERTRSSRSSQKKIYERKRIRQDWHRLGIHGLRIGKGTHELEGQIVPVFKGWKVKPKSIERPSGVIARLKSRFDWVQFEDPKYAYPNLKTRLAKNVEELIASSDERSKKLFLLLLKKLALQGLQNSIENDAVLAVSALVVRPEEDGFYSPTNLTRDGSAISLPVDPLTAFFDTPSEHRESALIALGVPSEHVPTQSQMPTDKKRSFIPRNSPDKALEVLEYICSNPGLDRSHYADAFGEDALYDLSGLNLVVKRQGKMYPKEDFPHDLTYTIKRAAGNHAAINICRVVLKANPVASGQQIGQAVAVQLNKSWETKGALLRRGNVIRQWLGWLEPHLIDPTSGISAAILAQSINPGHKPRRALSAEQAKRAQRMRDSGKSAKEIGRYFKVSARTITNYTVGRQGGGGAYSKQKKS